MPQLDDVQQRIHAYILEEFLAGEDPEQLTAETALLTTGILDSLATLKLVSFLESDFNISIGAHETGSENLETIARIATLVRSKG